MPLLYRTYRGNGSDQAVLAAAWADWRSCTRRSIAVRGGERPAQRTLVRDGGFWSPQLELDLDAAGYYSLISLPLGHKAAEEALQMAAQRGAMKPLSGKLSDVRAARMRTRSVSWTARSSWSRARNCWQGQKRGIAVALRKAKVELRKLEGLIEKGRITRSRLDAASEEGARPRAPVELRRDHHRRKRSKRRPSTGTSMPPYAANWRGPGSGRRVLCTDRHNWSTGRIVHAFRGQWNVEELFRRAKKGGVVPWGPSHQWADGSLRLHTFATVLGLMLVSLAKIALAPDASARKMMKSLARSRRHWCDTTTGGAGRRPTVMLAPELTAEQRRAVKVFALDKWFPDISFIYHCSAHKVMIDGAKPVIAIAALRRQG